MSVPAAVAGALRAIVGDRHVVEGATSLLTYESDALPGYRKRPAFAVFPGTRDELIAVVRTLAQHGVPYVPRGAGTGLSGGALADGVVLLGLQRLKRIVRIDPEARLAVVEPGVVNAWLTTAAAPHGLHYAPDPSSQTACTIGGNVAENAGGPHCLKYGATLNHILAATVALPSGELVTLHRPSRASEGYDLIGAFVGSEGCFGVAVDITVKLTPNPEAVRTLLADFTSVDDAARTTSAIVASGILPAACELMDRATINAVEASIYAAGYPADAAAVLLVEVDGDAASVAEEAARVEELCRSRGARGVRVAVDPVDRARLWQGRKKAFGAMGRMAPHLAVQDAVVPRTKLADILRSIAEIGLRHRVQVCNVFHAGDGNLHPNIPYNGRDQDEHDRVFAAMREIMQMCIESGGTITGEHGVGLDKLPYMEHLFTADTLDAMCRMRTAFDPDRRANPGKVVPVHSCREWHGTPAYAQHTAHDGVEAASANRKYLAPTASSTLMALERRIADAVHESRATGSALYIAGAGTHFGNPPRDAQRIDVSESNNVIEYVPDDLTITVGAGMTLQQLEAITAEHNQWCPLLPWGSDAATIGGTLASAARGPASATLGSPRDLTLGLSFVDGRGATARAGGRVVKNVAGFDLTRAMIGSWGSLGAITAVSLRLRARPAANEVWMFADGSAIPDALRAWVRGPLAPAALVHLNDANAGAAGLDGGACTVVWLIGGAAHVAASREALHAMAPAEALSPDVWRRLRAQGPFDSGGLPIALSPAMSTLNARVRAAFDPDNIFASPMPIRSASALPEFAHV
ncbi:MAG TPA: FAD-linked oxidase C-terminal domain-containing protein [Gemmatimonadaceae bacterium]|nr:FAD-linked oxidase C-terminal domain-containing protein [Gemmatimonadaceae bacterium]